MAAIKRTLWLLPRVRGVAVLETAHGCSSEDRALEALWGAFHSLRCTCSTREAAQGDPGLRPAQRILEPWGRPLSSGNSSPPQDLGSLHPFAAPAGRPGCRPPARLLAKVKAILESHAPTRPGLCPNFPAVSLFCFWKEAVL